jgi:PHD/YefM family antitoxin component YafN of YafNO toxin-antitoxin module
MATIRPSSDLCNKYDEISDFCHTNNEPVFITKNGVGDMVMLSNAEYERLSGKHELYRLLEEGYAAMKKGDGQLASEVFDSIEKEFDLSDGVQGNP